MIWEEKVKMIYHFNKEEYQEGVKVFLSNINNMDAQGIDMFITGLDLNKETLSKSLSEHKEIIEKLKSEKFDNFRTALRMSLYETLIYELLNNQE